MSNNKIVTVDNLTCIFDPKTENEVVAINNFSYQFEKNKIHFIIGNSGSGKSTLVLHFNGLLKSKKGNINIDDFKIEEKKRKIKNIKELRKKISLVFQYPEYQLFKDTIEKDIYFGPKSLKIQNDLYLKLNKKNVLKLLLSNKSKYEINNLINSLDELDSNIKKIKFKKDEAICFLNNKKIKVKYKAISKNEILKSIAKENLERMGMDESFLKKSPFGLSGGQKRRVAIAGILAINPKILVFDEPTAGLDPDGISEMMEIIKSEKNKGKTIFVITHSMDEVLEIADNVIVMENGKVLTHGTPYEIFKNNEIYTKTKITPPKVIDTIIKLEEQNKKFSILWDKKPKTCEELASEINKILINKKRR